MGTETAEKLRKALELLGPNGENWIQGCSFKDGRRCAGYAIETVGKTPAKVDDIWDKFTRFIPAGELLTRWNDAPERTFSEVREVFEQAIRAAESEGSQPEDTNV